MTDAVGSPQVAPRTPALGQRLLIAALGLAGAAPLALLPYAANQASYQLIAVAYGFLFKGEALQGFFGLSTLILAASAPLLGLLADLVGRRKALVAGALILGLALVAPLPGDVAAVSLDRLAMMIGIAIVLATLPGVLLEAVHSHRLFSTVSGAFLAAGMAGIVLVVRLAEPPDNPPLVVIAAGIGFLVLAIGVLGDIPLFVGYTRGRRYEWPRAWLEADRNRAWFLAAFSGVLAAALAHMVNSFRPVLIAQAAGRLGIARPQESAASYVGEQSIYIVSLLVGGLLGDGLAWLCARSFHRPLGRPLLLLLGALAQVASVLIMMLGASWSLVALDLVLEMAGLGLVCSQALALLAANVRSRWWGTAAGLFTLATLAYGLVINPLWRLVRAIAGDNSIPILGLGLPALVLVFAVITVLAALPRPAVAPVHVPAVAATEAN